MPAVEAPTPIPLLTRRIARQLKLDAPLPTAEQTVYRVVGRVCGDVCQRSSPERYHHPEHADLADSEDGSPVFTAPVWLGRWLGLLPCGSKLVLVRTMNTQWAESLREGHLVDVTARVRWANSSVVSLWREADA